MKVTLIGVLLARGIGFTVVLAVTALADNPQPIRKTNLHLVRVPGVEVLKAKTGDYFRIEVSSPRVKGGDNTKFGAQTSWTNETIDAVDSSQRTGDRGPLFEHDPGERWETYIYYFKARAKGTGKVTVRITKSDEDGEGELPLKPTGVEIEQLVSVE